MTPEPTPGPDTPTPPANPARDPGPGGSGRPRNPSPVRLAAIEALQAVAANLPGRPDEVLTAIEGAAHDTLARRNLNGYWAAGITRTASTALWHAAALPPGMPPDQLAADLQDRLPDLPAERLRRLLELAADILA